MIVDNERTFSASGGTAPEGWADGNWRLDARTDLPGWLGQPARVDDVDAWVDEAVQQLRASWGEAWTAESENVVAQLLRLGLEARPPEAALAFQLWPIAAPLVCHVQVSFGERPSGFVLGPHDGVLYEASGVGFGVQRVERAELSAQGGELVGTNIVFLAEEAAVIARLEPTLPEIFAAVLPAFHRFVQTLQLIGPDGRARVSSIPSSFAESRDHGDWADTVAEQ